jgi:hypothetical protein
MSLRSRVNRLAARRGSPEAIEVAYIVPDDGRGPGPAVDRRRSMLIVRVPSEDLDEPLEALLPPGPERDSVIRRAPKVYVGMHPDDWPEDD